MRDILNLDDFPLDLPGSDGWAALVDQCRADLAADGMFNLPGLMKGAVAADAVSTMAPDHPALRLCETSNRTLCADQIAGSALLRLYEWPAFAQFLAATMHLPALHVMQDPLARVNVMSYGAGQALNWHFDRSEFTTTLLLQAPEQGGDFEYRSDLRTDDDPNYDGVARLLRGQDAGVKHITLAPGTLNVFKGKNTAHRVTPVAGGKARVIAVFSYYDRPGVIFSEEERIGFYGRAS